MCYKLPRICSVCRNCNPVLYSFMTYQSVCDTRVIRRDVTGGAGTAYPSAVPEFTHGFREAHVARWLLFCVVFVYHFCAFLCSFGHCIVCLSFLFGFGLSFWYLQTFLVMELIYSISINVHTLSMVKYCLSSSTIYEL